MSPDLAQWPASGLKVATTATPVGRKGVADMLAAAAIAVPPTKSYNVTGFGNNSDAGNTQIAGSVAIPYNDPRLSWLHGKPRLYGGGTSAYVVNPFAAVLGDTPASTITRSGIISGLGFEWEGQAFELKVFGNSTAWFLLWVNDGTGWRPHVMTPEAITKNDGLQYLLKFDFGARAKRQIYLVLEGLLTGGLRVEPTATVVPLDTGRRMLIVGDSFSVPGQAQFRSSFGYALRLARRLGILDVVISGHGGTGFVNDSSGTGLRYLDRLQAPGGIFAQYTAASDFALILVQGSINEESLAGLPSVNTAVRDTLAAVASRYPSARLFTCSPMLPSKGDATANGQDVTLRDQIKAQADPLGIPFFDALTADNAKFQYGTGKVGAVVGDGNADFNAFTDGRHPSAAAALGAGASGGAVSVGDRLALFAAQTFGVPLL